MAPPSVAHSALVVALLLSSCSTVASQALPNAYSIWHPIDVPMVVCTANGAPGRVQVDITAAPPDMQAPNQWRPHIITFYRTSSAEASITYHVIDSSPTPKTVVGTNTVVLQALTPPAGNGSRRLGASVIIGANREKACSTWETDTRIYSCASLPLCCEGYTGMGPSSDTVQCVPADSGNYPVACPQALPGGDEFLQEFPELEEYDVTRSTELPHKEGRALKKSSGGGSRTRASSSSSSNKNSYSSSSSSSNAAKTSNVNKNSISARRRGAPAPSSPAPASSVTGKRDTNPSNPSAGSYGYTNTQRMNSNYPNSYSQTGYGYSGASAKPSSSRIMMAGAAGMVGGMAVGMGAMYMYSRWNSGWGYSRYGDQCSSPGGTSMSCRECYRRYSSCSQRLPEDANRDDLMKTGFIPADLISPIKVIFTGITGVDYAASKICPPAGWNPNESISTASWSPPSNQDIFLTLTELNELAEASVGVDAAWGRRGSTAFLFSFCLAGLAVLEHGFRRFAH